MKDWVPLFQSLVWPVFVGIILIFAKTPFLGLLDVIQKRIIAGADFEAGPTGIKIGQAPKLADVEPTKPGNVADHKKSIRATSENGPLEPVEASDIYLVHTARRDAKLDRGGRAYYRVRLYLDADHEETLDRVTEVTYYLHPTFKDPVRVVRNRDTSFEIRTVLWGEFNVAANVHFKNGTNRELERYINI